MISSLTSKIPETYKHFVMVVEINKEELREKILKKYNSPRDYLLMTPEKRTR